MQQDPLLEQLDWCFTSVNWILDYPNTLLLPLARPISDHIPCVASIGTSIPKARVFRFENHWLDQPGFMAIVQATWNSEVRARDSVSRVVAKLKLLRRVLRRWGRNLSQLNLAITNCNTVIFVLDKMEENRPLFTQEFNLRNIVKSHLLRLLNAKKEYWKKRYTVRWTRFGDEGTSFFHVAATERYRLNTITSITTDSGEELTAHHEKAAAFWEEYK